MISEVSWRASSFVGGAIAVFELPNMIDPSILPTDVDMNHFREI